ncbi:hypothetical protein YPPY05_1873, partial [Yersinia pestis PY-05]
MTKCPRRREQADRK